MNRNEQPLTETMFYILLALHHPLHGYGISQEVESMTAGRLHIGAGTLYGALKTLSKNGWIEQVGSVQDARGKKEYLITKMGTEIFNTEIMCLKEMLKNAAKAEKPGKENES